jgi:hypothetical protein
VLAFEVVAVLSTVWRSLSALMALAFEAGVSRGLRIPASGVVFVNPASKVVFITVSLIHTSFS